MEESRMPFDLTRIGKVLKTGREERHLSLQKISDVLFIRKRIIEAIEAGDWNALPHMVYVKGYVGQYASYLGIQHEIDEELNNVELNITEQKLPIIENLDTSGPGWWVTRRKQVGFAAFAIVVLGFIVFQNIPRESNTFAPVYQGTSNPIRAVSGVPYEVQGDIVVTESKKLIIVCQQRTWVRIVIDGSEKKEFMMNPEEVVVLNGKEGFDLLIGNAAGVKLFYNGKDTDFSGEEGEVRRINLS
jgi:hypothetical protein